MTNYENRVQTSDDMNWTPDQLRNYMTRRLAQEQRAREGMQEKAQQIPVQGTEPLPRQTASRSRKSKAEQGVQISRPEP